MLSELSSDIAYCDKDILHFKIMQFWNFMHEQKIARSVLDRICCDYSYKLDEYETIFRGYNNSSGYVAKIFDICEHGVFGYFIIKKSVESQNLNGDELNLIKRFNRGRLKYDELKQDYIDLVFSPFVRLLDLYLTEKKSESINDYFTTCEIEALKARLDEAIEKIELQSIGQEVIFDSIDELKELTLELNKKNWIELFKGKMIDKFVDVLVINNMDSIIQQITGIKIHN